MAAGRSPTASGAMKSPLAGSREHQKGVEVFRKDLLDSCWLQYKGCGNAWREAGGDVE